MERTRLVQRLTKPYPDGALGFKDNPFSFGGGYRNGGLSDQAMDLLRGIFAFDYMGSAEFEFGAVPEALQRIAAVADKGALAARETAIDLATVPSASFTDKTRGKGSATVYLLGPADDLDEIESRVRYWASKPHDRKLQEPTLLHVALRPQTDWHHDVAGWLELDNGFFFFTDPEMFTKTAALFGVQTQTQENA